MKPRLYLRHGIWGCISWENGGRSLKMGHGYTPEEAYADWKSPAKYIYSAV